MPNCSSKRPSGQRGNWAVLVVEGVALVLFGVLALSIPPLISLGIASALGWILFFGGIAAMVVYARLYQARGFRYLLFSAVLGMIAGLSLLVRPVSGVISLTVVLIVSLAFAGVANSPIHLSIPSIF